MGRRDGRPPGVEDTDDAWADLRSRGRAVWPMRRDERPTRGRTAAWMLLRRLLPTMVFLMLRRGEPG